MKKIYSIFLLSFLLFTSGSLSAQTIQDTLTARTVAPGVIHYQFQVSGPRIADVLEIELDNPYIKLETTRPASGLSRTTAQSAANDREGHRVIGAVNGDFYSFETHRPVSSQVINGEVVKGVYGTANPRTHFAIDDQNRPHLGRLRFTGEVTSSDGTAFEVREVNESRPSGAVVFYNSWFGHSTGTSGGVEYSVELAEGQEWVTGSPMNLVVTGSSTSGGMSIPSNGGVLSAGSGNGLDYLSENLEEGDEITLNLGFDPDRSLIQLMGADHTELLVNGEDASTGSTSTHVLNRHPRTFVGIDQDTTKAYFVTVDGRQQSSVGINYREMATFLKALGAWNAVNLDGGGSTTMVVRGEVTNSPSDPGGERSVANTLQVISTAPLGDLHHLEIDPQYVEVFQDGTFQFTASGTDQYHNPIDIPQDAVWAVDSNIGTIDQSGLFVAENTNDEGYVTLTSGDVVDSARVVVYDLSAMQVYPSTLNMVPGERLTLEVYGYTTEGTVIKLDNNQVEFTQEGRALDVNTDGVVTVTRSDSGTLTASINDLTFEIPVDSEGGPATAVVDSLQTLRAWESMTDDNVTFELNEDTDVSDRPVFHITSSGTGQISLQTHQPTASRVDSIYVDVYGDGGGQSLVILFEDRNGRSYELAAQNQVTWTDEWRKVRFSVTDAGGSINYPLTLKELEIDMGSDSELYLRNLEVHYPNRLVEPEVLWDFTSIAGWFTPAQTTSGQIHGVNIRESSLVQSSERSYYGDFSGKWTYVDDESSNDDWDIRITRGANQELGDILRGSYVGAWVYAEGQTNTNLQIVIRDGAGILEQGPLFPVNHEGWKLIGTRLDDNLFQAYLNGNGSLTDTGNQFNGFRLTGSNDDLQGETRVFYIDKLVTSALTVPTGFHQVNTSFVEESGVHINWTVNNEMGINRYVIERAAGTTSFFFEVGTVDAVGNSDVAVEYQFIDTPDQEGDYTYRVRQITNDGAQESSPSSYVDEVKVVTSIGETDTGIKTFQLNQNYPNPFNPSTTISYQLPQSSQVRLTVWNVLGQRVSTLVNEIQAEGTFSVDFDASHLSSGVYFYRIEADPVNHDREGFVMTRKLMFLK